MPSQSHHAGTAGTAVADIAAAADREADARAESFLHVPSLSAAQPTIPMPARAMPARAVATTSSQFAIDSSKAPAPTDDATSLPRPVPDLSPAPSQTSLAAAVDAALGGTSTSTTAEPARAAQMSASLSPEAVSAAPGSAAAAPNTAPDTASGAQTSAVLPDTTSAAQGSTAASTQPESMVKRTQSAALSTNGMQMLSDPDMNGTSESKRKLLPPSNPLRPAKLYDVNRYKAA